ncbi:hypothetical protein [Myroides odoratimimus]|uniref:hypothetical protein n=1 Tax=Myroides odoratimimus TaxID=76832 RepID=UPI00257712DF|nr:hypothetical protein [Myroides odoratimimus]MDM1039830.1 hypothetical protein [Myroides odoratimimus]MDM1054070.1 hypothetical protein [Myroides odoratimimus]MDM1060874.1 hypothetical protein [Myroides odoratimimus]MDM1098297.1 hypothetical protein [Myroides odoratimimus]
MKYTTSDISATLGVSLRTSQRYIESLTIVENGKTFLSEDVFNLIISRHLNDKEATDEKELEGITEFFTNEEYEEFQKRLTEYPMLKQMLKASEEYISSLRNDVEYHRAIYQKHLDIHEKLIESIKERNFIEAKEKKLDK